jgi:hypothetical protein
VFLVEGGVQAREFAKLCSRRGRPDLEHVHIGGRSSHSVEQSNDEAPDAVKLDRLL